MNKSMSIFCYVFVKLESIIFLVNFVILDCEANFKVPIILERPFLTTRWTSVDMEMRQINIWLNKNKVNFNVCMSIKQQKDMSVISAIATIDKDELVIPIRERLSFKALTIIKNKFCQ